MRRFWNLLVALLLGMPLYGQQVAVSTNLAQYLNFGTLNGEIAVSAARHWTLSAAGRYNPFAFRTGEDETRELHRKQLSLSLGGRYWPWHVYSGWWLGGRAQYQIYNSGGLTSPQTREGERYGMSLGGGYTYMLSDRVNVDFGLSFWGGYDQYTTYDCPVCGLTLNQGNQFFVLPDEAIISLVYLF